MKFIEKYRLYQLLGKCLPKKEISKAISSFNISYSDVENISNYKEKQRRDYINTILLVIKQKGKYSQLLSVKRYLYETFPDIEVLENFNDLFSYCIESGKEKLIKTNSLYLALRNPRTYPLLKTLTFRDMDLICENFSYGYYGLFQLPLDKFKTYLDYNQKGCNIDSRLLFVENKILNSMEMEHFKQLLFYVSSGKEESDKDNRSRLLRLLVSRPLSNHYLQFLTILPDSFYSYYASDLLEEDKVLLFLNHLSKSKTDTRSFLSFRNKKCEKDFFEVLLMDSFWNLEENQYEILKTLSMVKRDSSYTFEQDSKRFDKKRRFLLGDETQESFLEQIDLPLRKTVLEFLGKDEKLEVIEKRIILLKEIKTQMIGKNLESKTLKQYLIHFECGKKMKSANIYFKEHSLQNFYDKLNSSKGKEQLEKVISENLKKKSIPLYYQVAEAISLCDIEVIDSVLEHFSFALTIKEKEGFVDFIKREEFQSADPSSQLAMLSLSPFHYKEISTSDFIFHVPNIKMEEGKQYPCLVKVAKKM